MSSVFRYALKIDILQWDLGERYDRYEDHDDHGDGVRVTFGDEDVGGYFIVNSLTEHNKTRNGDGEIQEILQTL